jgi:cobalt-precorrin-5B (C1)-methyltransferase
MRGHRERPDQPGPVQADPIEGYSYPLSWYEGMDVEEVGRKVGSGLFILSPDGWIRRGLTTGTTATAALCGILSGEEEVVVRTNAGIDVAVRVRLENDVAIATKDSGDHSFDVTDKVEFHARRADVGLSFGEGVGRFRGGRPAVSGSAMGQLEANMTALRVKGLEGSVEISIPRGRELWASTDNHRLGITGGISILGSTGFVEPWGERLLRTKIEIARQYPRVSFTTGRRGWRWSRDNIPGYQPFVFGVNFEEPLSELQGQEIVLSGHPSLLIKWAMPEFAGRLIAGRQVSDEQRAAVMDKAREYNGNVVDVRFMP